MMHPMKSLFPFRLFASAPEAADVTDVHPSAPTDSAAQVFPALAPALNISSTIHPVAAAAIASLRSRKNAEEPCEPGSTLLRTVGWISAGIGAVALGLVVGREIRQRYKFNRRTPYDFYAHAGDEQDLEFGVGI
jgi:hypothetical protein